MFNIAQIILCSYFVLFTTSTCLNNSEIDGKCSSCEPVKVLIKGYCYDKIRGCLVQADDQSCEKCQNGYVYDQGKCIGEAIFFNRQKLDPAPIRPHNADKITPEDIINNLTKKYGGAFINSHKYLSSKYPSIFNSTILKTNTLKFTTGNIVTTLYSLSANQTAVYTTQQDIYENIVQLSTNSIIQIQKRINKEDQDYSLYSVQESQKEVVFVYIGKKENVKKITVKKGEEEGRESVEKLKVSDLALQEVRKIQKQFQNSEVKSVKNPSKNFYIFEFQGNLSVSVQFTGKFFIVNKPLKIPQIKNTIVGGFSALTDKTNPRFLSAQSYLSQHYPIYKQSKLLSIKQQIVSGKNYLFSFKSPQGDTYTAKLYQNLQRKNKILSVLKNQMVIESIISDYHQDQLFLRIYPMMKEQSRVFNIPPIRSVRYKVVGEKIQYQVVYGEGKQSMEFVYDKNVMKAKLISYTVEGENIYDVLPREQRKIGQQSSIVEFTKQQIFEKIVSLKPQFLKENTKIISFNTPTPTTYDIQLLTHQGTFLGHLQNQNNHLTIKFFLKNSNKTCYTPQSNTQTSIIDKFILNQFSTLLNNFTLINIHENLQDNKQSLIKYLYQNDNLKQIIVTMTSVKGSLQIKAITVLNSGYQILQRNSKEYQMVQSLLNKEEGKKLIYSQFNGNDFRAFTANARQISEYIISKSMQIQQKRTIGKRKKFLIPAMFEMKNLILPTDRITDQQNQEIEEILRVGKMKFPQHLAQATVAFADYFENVYNIMFKSLQYGYVRAKIQVNQSQILNNFDQIFLTTYTDQNFGQCKNFSQQGQCLSCQKTTQNSFQGECHPKQNECLIQTGQLCIKCKSGYIQIGYKCSSDCESFFT